MVVAGALDSQPLYPIAKRIRMEIQDSRCSLWSFNHPTGPFKGSEDVRALNLLQSGEGWRFRGAWPRVLIECFEPLCPSTRGGPWQQLLIDNEGGAR